MLSPADKSLAVRTEDYLTRVDNIVYGDDPRQGYVEAGAFYHPVMRFQFAVPAQWNVENSPSQVSLVSPDKQAAFILEAEQSQENLQSYAAKKAQAIENRQFLHDQSLLINGLSSYHQMYDIPQQDAETLRARLSFIRKGGTIFSFTALSTMANFGGHDGQFQQIVRSFRDLSDPRYINRQPSRLRVVRGDGRSSLQAILQGNGVKKDLWPKLAIQNGLEINQAPAAGRLVKIVR
jgi:predicted Zn-dependent protease